MSVLCVSLIFATDGVPVARVPTLPQASPDERLYSRTSDDQQGKAR